MRVCENDIFLFTGCMLHREPFECVLMSQTYPWVCVLNLSTRVEDPFMDVDRFQISFNYSFHDNNGSAVLNTNYMPVQYSKKHAHAHTHTNILCVYGFIPYDVCILQFSLSLHRTWCCYGNQMRLFSTGAAAITKTLGLSRTSSTISAYTEMARCVHKALTNIWYDILFIT